MIAIFLIGAALAQPKCEGVSVESLELSDQRAVALMMELQTQELAEFAKDTIGSLPCVSERLPPSAIASVHGMSAIAALAAGRRDEVPAHLYAAGLASVGYKLPEAIPSTHPLRALQAQAASFPNRASAPKIVQTIGGESGFTTTYISSGGDK